MEWLLEVFGDCNEGVSARLSGAPTVTVLRSSTCRARCWAKRVTPPGPTAGSFPQVHGRGATTRTYALVEGGRELLEAATWLVYALAAIGMFGAIVAAVLAGFALRFVATVLWRITGEGREEGGPDASILYSSARRGKGA